MRYAIPVDGAQLADHFGHCEQFALVDVDELRKEILRKETVPAPAHQPGLLPKWLAEQGVSVVIAVGMGSRAQSIFQQNNIKVVIGAMSEDPERAVMDYMDGKLATGDNICDH
ncbi:MAG: NifB/NifX family molybdenum-iron cluster-binding protein [Dehalococcoidia bacterium]